jgi:hypothetical protein
MKGLKGLATPRLEHMQMLSYKPRSTAAAFVIHTMRWKSPMASNAITLCRTLWYGEQPNEIARQLDFCFIIFKDKFKASNTLLNITENTKTRKIVYWFLV